MLNAILTTETGEIRDKKEMIGADKFPPAVYFNGGFYLLLMHKSPSEAFYRATRYYLFPPNPDEAVKSLAECDRSNS